MARPKHRRFVPRRWPFFAVISSLVIAILLIIVPSPQQPDDVLTISDRPLTPVVSPPSPVVVASSIAPSPVTQLFVPSLDANLEINNGVLPLDGCRNEINPPLDGYHIGAVYECMDFEHPSSASTSISVLAGHSSCLTDTVFNRLNVQRDTLIGREVWIKTQASGNKWLIYQIETTYEPLKSELGNMEEIWGSSEIKTDGKLALITCLLGDCDGGSTNNFVVTARYTGIR